MFGLASIIKYKNNLNRLDKLNYNGKPLQSSMFNYVF